MTACPFGPDSVYRWRHGHSEIAAKPAGYFRLEGRYRALLIDTAEQYWTADIDAAGKLMRIVAGPVTAEQALFVAELAITGSPGHGSVSGAISTLAIGLMAKGFAQPEPNSKERN